MGDKFNMVFLTLHIMLITYTNIKHLATHHFHHYSISKPRIHIPQARTKSSLLLQQKFTIALNQFQHLYFFLDNNFFNIVGKS